MESGQNYHREGHPDDNPKNEWLSIMEGLLDTGTLSSIIDQHTQLGNHFSNRSEAADGAGKSELAVLNHIAASIHIAALHNSVLQIGLAKRLDDIFETLKHMEE